MARCATIVLMFVAASTGTASELEITVATDRPEYFQGQEVTVLVEVAGASSLRIIRDEAANPPH